MSNGLGSPLCAGAPAAGELPAESKRHCETSGFAAAAAPTGNYGVDVHIDTGLFGFSQGELLNIVQDVFIAPVWMAIVWAVHALVVMLEWCFRLDIIDSGPATGIGAGLQRMLGSVTDAWLPIVLALASVAAVYNGLIRRRVADTIGQALLMAGMMAGAMWVSIDPAGTVGSLGQWANEASLGTLAAATQGAPARADGALATSLASVFAAAVEAPWCYMEFGDVDWCRSTERLDPRLRAVGMKIATDELAQSGCTVGVPSRCGAGAGASAKELQSSAELLRSAQSNGALFLSLPANGPARNSINDGGSLLRALCSSSEATNCRGPTAAQAEFRTNSGTWPRVGGLLLILAGVVGMLLLLGFIAMRLLAAAIFSLLYLLLAPGMVLAPAFGESGRAIFRAWGARLLGAVIAKLLFAFLLGVVLAILAILSRLGQLGWWTQWLLMSAFWWGAFMRRGQALGAAHVALGREPRPASRSRARRIGDALEARALSRALDRVERKRRSDAPRDENRGARAPARERARPRPLEGLARWRPSSERADALAGSRGSPRTRERLTGRRAQLERVRSERRRAAADGDTRRAAELAHREQRIVSEVEDDQAQLGGKRSQAGEGARGPGPRSRTREHIERRTRFLDEQAALPSTAQAGEAAAGGRPPTRARDYPALAGLAGYGREGYEALDPARRRAARLAIDRELTMRSALGGAVPAPSSGAQRSAAASPARRAPLGAGTPARESAPGSPGAPIGGRRPTAAPRGESSSVMRDAREVEARRKRQLGIDRS